MPRSKGNKSSHHGRASIDKTGFTNGRQYKNKLMRRIERNGGPMAKVHQVKPTITGNQTRKVPRNTPRVTGAQKRKQRRGLHR